MDGGDGGGSGSGDGGTSRALEHRDAAALRARTAKASMQGGSPARLLRQPRLYRCPQFDALICHTRALIPRIQ